MLGRGYMRRLLVSIAVVGLMGACGASATLSPPSATPAATTVPPTAVATPAVTATPTSTLNPTLSPTPGPSSTLEMTTGRAYHTATLLSDGRVLIAGGQSDSASKAFDLYDPKTASFARRRRRSPTSKARAWCGAG